MFVVLVASFLLSQPAIADTLEQRTSFNVNSTFDKYKRTTLSATLRKISDNAYFYIEDSYWNGLSSSQQNSLMTNVSGLADYFTSNIYPRETAFFGSEPRPGVDGDNKITILLEELINNNGGYFDTANGYPKSDIEDSNAREILFLNVEVVVRDLNFSKIFLAHEFQHLISFNQKEKTFNLSEDVWLNEMRSEYAISKAGLNDTFADSSLDRRVSSFISNYADSLTEWPNENADYGIAAVFAEYLAEQFGDSIFSETMKMPLTGIESLNQFLTSRGFYSSSPAGAFGDVFMNWLGALYLNDTSKNPKLGYKRPELSAIHVVPQQRVNLSSGLPDYSIAQNLKDWQPSWLEFNTANVAGDSSKSFKISIDGESGHSYLASYLAFYNTGAVELGKIKYSGGVGNAFVSNSADKRLEKIVIMSTKNTKIFSFGTREPQAYLNVRVSAVDSSAVKVNMLIDGALIKRPNESEIYVIWGKYRRYLNPGVISLYGHLNPADAIELGPEEFNQFTTSNYVKFVDDEKVYAVWPDSTKHWLNITPQQWDATHRDWNAIFTINEHEVNYYRTGAEIRN